MGNLHNILEMVYFISGPLLLIVAYKGLEQIKEARNQSMETRESRIINSKRESYRISAEKCEYYLSTIIPLQNNLSKEVKSKGITFFKNSEVIINGDEIKVIPSYRDEEEFNLIWKELPTLEVFNAMEGFSIFFTSGIADEEIGFLTVGWAYCQNVKRYLPHLLDLASTSSYSNIIKLFKIWNARLEAAKLEKEKERIENEISKNKPKSIETIGTK